MKKTLTLAGLGACMLLVFPSCKSTDDDGFSGSFEEAMPMSTVGNDELPPWLLEDSSDSGQVDAGETTLIPAPDEPVADGGGRASTRQNQPSVASTDDVVVDTPSAPVPAGIDPLAGTPVNDAITAPTPAAPKVTTPSKPKTTTGKASTGKATASGKKPAKTGKKISQPTMIVYKVRKGDNLSDIAKRSNTTVAQIRKDSGIKGDLIRPGQVIKVRYTPKDYKPSKNTAKNAKGGKNVKANTKTATQSYSVRRGETISGIAKKNGVSTAALLKANNMKAADASKLRAGQKLVIPKN